MEASIGSLEGPDTSAFSDGDGPDVTVAESDAADDSRALEPYDLIVLGGGSAGSACAAEAVKLGHQRVLLINADKLGGLCILRGCMPTKALLHPTDLLHDLRHGEDIGVRAENVSVDVPLLFQRKREMVERFQRAKIGGMENGGYEILFGRARFSGPDRVRIEGGPMDGKELTAKAFLVATGSRQFVPPLPGLEDVPYLTSDEVLEQEELPESIIALGAGAIGLEFSTFYAGLGVRTTLVNRTPVLNRGESPDLSAQVQRALEHGGVRVVAPCTIHEARRNGERVELVVERDGLREIVSADALLLATGRVANLEDLGLEEAGVEIERGRPVLDDALRTTNPKVFVAGDATGDRLILHTGNAEGRHVARNLKRHSADVKLTPWREAIPVSATFTHPPYAEVGLTETAARNQGLDVVTAQKNWANQGRGIVMNTLPEGAFIKLIAERRTARLIGAQILGPRADDLIHILSTAMFYSGTARDLLAMPWYHPTLSEGVLEMAREVAQKAEA